MWSFAAEFICDAWGPIDATSVDRAAATELYPSGRLPNPDGCRSAILLKGAILPGDGERFAKLLRQSHPFLSSVMLWSPGGSVEDAMKIGRLIRKGLIDTEAPWNWKVQFNENFEKRPGWGHMTYSFRGAWTSVCAPKCIQLAGWQAHPQLSLRERLLSNLGGRCFAHRQRARTSSSEDRGDCLRQDATRSGRRLVSPTSRGHRQISGRNGNPTPAHRDHDERRRTNE